MPSSDILDRISLQTADYAVIILGLVIPLGIGVFFAVRDAKKVTRDEYLLGGRQMAVVPVLLSIFVTFQSAITLIGIPSEIYLNGPMLSCMYVGISLSFVISYFTLTPLIYPLQMTSIYEYLQMRFDSSVVRLLSTILGMLQTFFYLSVALLAPGLALEAAARIPFWLSVVIVGGIGTVYTAVGGMKSVIWTDAFQTVIVFVGVFAVIFKSVYDVGGLEQTWDIAEAGGRTRFDKFVPYLRVRHTWLGVVLGGTITWLTNLFSQSTCQRITSMKSLKDARMAMVANVPINIVYAAVVTFMSICMYSYLHHIRCDPLQAGLLKNSNQIMPFFVLHVMHDLPGFAGLYMSSLFSGALSTLSSGISALAANTVEDLLHKPLKSFSEKTTTTITKLLVFLYGSAIVILVYLAKNLQGQVTQMAVSVFGCFGSSVLGMFILGCSVPWANKYGAVSGAAASFIANIWLIIGGRLYGRKVSSLEPVSSDRCFNSSTSDNLLMNTTASYNVSVSEILTSPETVNSSPYSVPDTFSVYDISYEWYSVIGIILCMIVGLFVSRITRHKFPKAIEPKLIVPILRKFWNMEDPDVTVIHETNGTTMKDEYDNEMKRL